MSFSIMQIARSFHKRFSRIWLSFLILLLCAGWVWKDFNSSYLTIETELQISGTQQIFWDDGSGFNEENSHRQFIEQAGRWNKYKIPITTLSKAPFRLDPSDTDGWVKIRRLSWKPKNSFLASQLMNLDSLLGKKGVAEITSEDTGNYWLIVPEAGNSDPHVILKSPTTENSFKKTIVRQIMFWLTSLASIILVAFAADLLWRRIPKKRALSMIFKFSFHPAVVTGGILLGATTLIFAVSRESNTITQSQILKFGVNGIMVEYIELEIDIGDGFDKKRKKAYWNRTHSKNQEITFLLNQQNLRRIRLTFHGSERGNLTISQLMIKAKDREWAKLDMTDWSILNGGSFEKVGSETLQFKNNVHGCISIQSGEIDYELLGS